MLISSEVTKLKSVINNKSIPHPTKTKEYKRFADCIVSHLPSIIKSEADIKTIKQQINKLCENPHFIFLPEEIQEIANVIKEVSKRI